MALTTGNFCIGSFHSTALVEGFHEEDEHAGYHSFSTRHLDSITTSSVENVNTDDGSLLKDAPDDNASASQQNGLHGEIDAPAPSGILNGKKPELWEQLLDAEVRREDKQQEEMVLGPKLQVQDNVVTEILPFNNPFLPIEDEIAEEEVAVKPYKVKARMPLKSLFEKDYDEPKLISKTSDKNKSRWSSFFICCASADS